MHIWRRRCCQCGIVERIVGRRGGGYGRLLIFRWRNGGVDVAGRRRRPGRLSTCRREGCLLRRSSGGM